MWSRDEGFSWCMIIILVYGSSGVWSFGVDVYFWLWVQVKFCTHSSKVCRTSPISALCTYNIARLIVGAWNV